MPLTADELALIERTGALAREVVAPQAARWEREHGCTVYDTTTTVIWQMLKMLGGPLPPAADWGRWLTT